MYIYVECINKVSWAMWTWASLFCHILRYLITVPHEGGRSFTLVPENFKAFYFIWHAMKNLAFPAHFWIPYAKFCWFSCTLGYFASCLDTKRPSGSRKVENLKKVAPCQLYIALPLNFLLVSSHGPKVLPSIAASLYNKIWVIWAMPSPREDNTCSKKKKKKKTSAFKKKII